MDDTITKADLPASFGSLKPVGHVMLGLPSKLAAHATVVALQREGIADAHITSFTPRETVEDMQAIADTAKLQGATLAVYDRSWIVEELI